MDTHYHDHVYIVLITSFQTTTIGLT